MNINDLQRRVLVQKKPAIPLLDEFPNAAAAYSLRLLRSGYTGNCIQVRRSSDNALQNIGFVNGVLDTASLLSFVGAGDGFVKFWYDQSGNGRNASSGTDAQQPRIVNAGILDVFNNTPVVRNPNVNTLTRLNIGGFSVLQPLPFTVIFAGKIDQRSTAISIYFGGSVNTQLGGRYNLACNDSFFSARRANTVTPLVIVNTANFDTNAFIQQGIFRESQLEGRQNGTDSTPVNYFGDEFGSTATITLFGGTTTVTTYPAISAYEYIIYLSDEHSNRIGIESNINAYYNIF